MDNLVTYTDVDDLLKDFFVSDKCLKPSYRYILEIEVNSPFHCLLFNVFEWIEGFIFDEIVPTSLNIFDKEFKIENKCFMLDNFKFYIHGMDLNPPWIKFNGIDKEIKKFKCKLVCGLFGQYERNKLANYVINNDGKLHTIFTYNDEKYVITQYYSVCIQPIKKAEEYYNQSFTTDTIDSLFEYKLFDNQNEEDKGDEYIIIDI